MNRTVAGIMGQFIKYLTIFLLGTFASAWMLGFYGILYHRGFTPKALTGGLAIPSLQYIPGHALPRLAMTGNQVIDTVFVQPINAILDASEFLYNTLKGGNGSG